MEKSRAHLVVGLAALAAVAIVAYWYVTAEMRDRNATYEDMTVSDVGAQLLARMEDDVDHATPWSDHVRRVLAFVRSYSRRDSAEVLKRLVFIPPLTVAERSRDGSYDQALVFVLPLPVIGVRPTAFLLRQRGTGYCCQVFDSLPGKRRSEHPAGEFFRIAARIWECGQRGDVAGIDATVGGLGDGATYIGYDIHDGRMLSFPVSELKALADALKAQIRSQPGGQMSLESTP